MCVCVCCILSEQVGAEKATCSNVEKRILQYTIWIHFHPYKIEIRLSTACIRKVFMMMPNNWWGRKELMWSEPSLSLISGWGATLGLCSMLNSSFQLTILFATTSNKYHQITCLCQANSFSSSRKSCLMLLLMCKEEKTKVSKTTFLHNELYLANPIPPLCALKSKKVLPTMYLFIQFWEVPNKCNLF